MPVKNGENYIKEALEGIKKQNMNLEIIVVDDGSDDNTAEIAKEFGCIIVKHEKSKGQVVAKNTALKIAKGEYIMFHDHDDIMEEATLQKLYDAIMQNKDISMVMAKVKDFISPDSKDKNTLIKKDAYWGLFTGAALIKKEVFDKIGLFDEDIQAGEIISFQIIDNVAS